jgi:hypothetical protein
MDTGDRYHAPELHLRQLGFDACPNSASLFFDPQWGTQASELDDVA